jgi:hypothetical protein
VANQWSSTGTESATVDLNLFIVGDVIAQANADGTGGALDYYTYWHTWYPLNGTDIAPSFTLVGFARSVALVTKTAGSGPGLLVMRVTRASIGDILPLMYLTIIDGSMSNGSGSGSSVAVLTGSGSPGFINNGNMTDSFSPITDGSTLTFPLVGKFTGRGIGDVMFCYESMRVDHTTFSKTILNLIESINLSLSQGTKASIKNVILDQLSAVTTLLIRRPITVSESIVLTSTLLAIIRRIESVIATILVTTSLDSKGTLLSNLFEVLSLLSLSTFGKSGTVSELITINSTILSLQSLINSVISSIVLTDTTINDKVLIIDLSESFSLDSALSSKSSLFNSLSDSFIIRIPSVHGQDSYLAYLLSPETNSISNYHNYNFDNCTKFGFKYLFSNSSGLFEYGGNTDDSTLIKATLETVAYDFGSSNLKQVPTVYLGYTSTGITIMKVRVNGKATAVYKLNKHTENLQTQKISVGKGLIGRYFQFELITEASDFSMESIEFYPVVLKRKL